MNSADIKYVIGKLEPDTGMEHRLAERLKNNLKRQSGFKLYASIAAGLAITLCISFFAFNQIKDRIKVDPGNIVQNTAQNEGVYIPRIKPGVAGKGKIMADMIGLIVYQGRIYSQSVLQLDSNVAGSLVGEKLGRTKGGIDEWSKKEDYAVELVSNIGEQDVYAVKGYDKSFRIMTYDDAGDAVNAQLYECLNDITVRTGSDIFEKLKIAGNVETAKYELFDSWNNGKQEFKQVGDMKGLDTFLTALYNSTPYEREGLAYLFEDQSSDSQKFIQLKLADGTELLLRLFKDGYVYYNGVNIFFKVEGAAFKSFWNELG